MNMLQTFIYKLGPRCLRYEHLVVVLIEIDGLIDSEHHLGVSWLQKVDLHEIVSITTSYFVDRTTQIIIKTYVCRRNDADCYRNICSSIERCISLFEYLFADSATYIVIKTSFIWQRDTDSYRNIWSLTAWHRFSSKHMVADSATQIVIEKSVCRQRNTDRY